MQIIRFSDSIISLRVAYGDCLPFLPVLAGFRAVRSLELFHISPMGMGLSEADTFLKD